MVEIRERVQEVLVPVYVEVQHELETKRPLFSTISDDELLGYGVPPEWLADVRSATEDTLLALADHLPSEAAEALLELATGGKPEPVPVSAQVTNPFSSIRTLNGGSA